MSFPHPHKPQLGQVFIHRNKDFYMYNHDCAKQWPYDGYLWLSYNGELYNVLREQVTLVTRLEIGS